MAGRLRGSLPDLGSKEGTSRWNDMAALRLLVQRRKARKQRKLGMEIDETDNEGTGDPPTYTQKSAPSVSAPGRSQTNQMILCLSCYNLICIYLYTWSIINKYYCFLTVKTLSRLLNIFLQ